MPASTRSRTRRRGSIAPGAATRGAVSLVRATEDAAPLLHNLLELYIHDLSEVFAVEIGADGRFGYDKLPRYWTDPESYHPFVIRCGGKVAGFALVTRGSPAIGDPAVFDVAEFFVLRAYRRMGVGRDAAFALWDTLRGRWVVRVAESHTAGIRFWSDVVRAYAGGALDETPWAARGDDWRVFAFDSRT
jgi:predicted acetyltransferase